MNFKFKAAVDDPMTDLIVKTEATASVSLHAETLKAAALESSALVCKVDDAATQTEAVAAQGKLLTLIRDVEKAREAVKKPVIELGRKIDAAAKTFVAELEEEGNRIAALVNEFQVKEMKRIASEQRLQDSSLSQLDREEAEKIACAETADEQQAIRDEYSQRRASVQQPLAPARAQGQRVAEDWEITVVNAYELAKFHPQAVKITPLLSEIKPLLNQGIAVHGITAKKVINATVKSHRQKPALEA